MSLGNLFKLAKLRIEAFSDIGRADKLTAGLIGGNSLEVMYNPETLRTRHESVLQSRQGVTSQGSQARWLHSRSRELSVRLVFDGTHVGTMGVELLRRVPTVAEWIKTFLSLCYDIQSESHEAAYLRLTWGAGIPGGDEGFECRLKSADIEYKLFDRDGSPLRAELTAVFVEAVDPEKTNARLRLSSPDLTHRRIVRAGDTLPQMCLAIYGSAAHYLRVAEVNGLDDFRRLEPGQELFFPPFGRDQRG